MTEHISEARRMAMRTIENWDYLNEEEKYGTLHEIVDQLAKAESNEIVLDEAAMLEPGRESEEPDNETETVRDSDTEGSK